MVRIRLRRMGSAHQPTYRIVVADKESPRDGAFIEIVGSYNPRTEPETVKVVEDRIFHWIKVGAQPSDSVGMILKKAGTLGRYERFLKGEAPETLKAEAAAVLMAAEKINPRTNIGRVAKARTKPFKKKDK
jgi:small subunit ribosomal protein S16